MAKGIPLTTTNIVSVLKKAGFVTKKDLDGFATKKDLVGFVTKDDLKNGLEGLRKQIDNDQFEARTKFHVKMTLPALEEVEKNLKVEIAKVNDKVDKLSIEVGGIKDDVEGLTGEFATTPSRKEFEEFKRAVISS